MKCSWIVEENVNVSKFTKTVAFPEGQKENYHPNKSKIMRAEQVTKFILETFDEKWLLTYNFFISDIEIWKITGTYEWQKGPQSVAKR